MKKEEGLVLKDLDSLYIPNERSKSWLKFKPDQLNCGDTLDLLIIGGFYGTK
jgi:DNA ligase 4